jgi:hypothetical protein
MSRRDPAELVIDACVARASGKENATYPTSKNCRDFLKAVLENGHRLAMTPDILAEWKAHESNFARKWRLGMIARKRITVLCVRQDELIRGKIVGCHNNERVMAIMLKDMLLIEAACATGNSVISIDEEARSHFNRTALVVTELRCIIWVNPDRAQESPVTWLERGAPREAHRMLGRQPPIVE